MVQWWKTKEAVQARVTEDKDGSYIMWMEGEKYPFAGYPRGHLIVNEPGKYSPYSRLKHEIKNQIFNENWYKIASCQPVEIHANDIFQLAETLKYDMMPVHKCTPAVREVNRLLPNSPWKDIITCIFQEDDAYRMRFQYLVQFLDKKDPIGSFDKAMKILENAEVVDDMKERINLIRVVLLKLWENPEYAKYWISLVKNMDFKKVKLTKADLYYLRAKFFKPDFKDPNTYLGRISNEILY